MFQLMEGPLVAMAVASMSNDVRIFVAGHRGMVGSAQRL